MKRDKAKEQFIKEFDHILMESIRLMSETSSLNICYEYRAYALGAAMLMNRMKLIDDNDQWIIGASLTSMINRMKEEGKFKE